MDGINSKFEEARKRKNTRNKEYYEKHKEALREKAKERYTPEKQALKAERYADNREDILAREREAYIKRQTTLKQQRIRELKDLYAENIAGFIDRLADTAGNLTNADITALEKCILLVKASNTSV